MRLALADLQQHFFSFLRGGDARDIQAEIDARGPVAVPLRLDIYANAYRKRLTETLENDHPQLGLYLGDELWDSLSAGYIDAHPSRYRSLRHFGADLPRYLARHEPFADHPELVELAVFERALLDVFDAGDAARADWVQTRELPQATWPQLRLRFHPSVQLFIQTRNVVQIWKALKAGDTPPGTQELDQTWLLWRDTDRVTRFRALDPQESAGISACLMKGRDFASLCEDLARYNDAERVPALALKLLRRWVDEGLVAQLVTDNNSPPLRLA